MPTGTTRTYICPIIEGMDTAENIVTDRMISTVPLLSDKSVLRPGSQDGWTVNLSDNPEVCSALNVRFMGKKNVT